MAAPTIFRSTDASAPILSGTLGSLISVLDGCLVTGYGSKSSLGWGKTTVSTNVAAYRASVGARQYLYLDDNQTGAPRSVAVRGYLTNAWNDPFPLASQSAFVCKSGTADAVARPWLVIGDDRTFYFFSSVLGTTPVLASHFWPSDWGFGEIYSFLPGDLYRTMLFYPLPNTNFVDSQAIQVLTSATSSAALNCAMPRSYLTVGGPIWAAPIFNSWWGYIGGSAAFPNASDGGIYVYKVLVNERGNAGSPSFTQVAPIRGRLRGLYGQIHNVTAAAEGDTFNGAGDYAGKTFMLVKVATASPAGGFAFETTDWEYSS